MSNLRSYRSAGGSTLLRGAVIAAALGMAFVWASCGGGVVTPPTQLTVPPGHNIGANCGTCHTPTGNLRRLSAAGTVYVDAAGSAPAPSATVRLTKVSDPASVVTATTNANGNFALPSNALDPAASYSVQVSKGADTVAMAQAVSLPSFCNSCHTPGSRVHVP